MTRTRSAAATVVTALASVACLATMASFWTPTANAEPRKQPHTGSPTPTASGTPTDSPSPTPTGAGGNEAYLWQTPITFDGRRDGSRLILTVTFGHASASVPWHAGCWVVAAEGRQPDFSCDPASTPTVVPDATTTHRLTATFKELADCSGARVVSGLPLGNDGYTAFDMCVEDSCGGATTVSFGTQKAAVVTSECSDDPGDQSPLPPKVGAHAPSNHAPRPPAQVQGSEVSRSPSPQPADTSSRHDRVRASTSPSASPSGSASPAVPEPAVVAGEVPPVEGNRHGWPVVALAALLVGGLAVAVGRVVVRPRSR